MAISDTASDPGRRAVFYLRIAREDHCGGGESASVRQQHEGCMRLAAEMGLQLEDFADEETPAGPTGGSVQVTPTPTKADEYWAARAIAGQMRQDGVASFGAYVNIDTAIEMAARIMARYGLDVTDSGTTDEVIDRANALREAMP